MVQVSTGSSSPCSNLFLLLPPCGSLTTILSHKALLCSSCWFLLTSFPWLWCSHAHSCWSFQSSWPTLGLPHGPAHVHLYLTPVPQVWDAGKVFASECGTSLLGLLLAIFGYPGPWLDSGLAGSCWAWSLLLGGVLRGEHVEMEGTVLSSPGPQQAGGWASAQVPTTYPLGLRRGRC